MELKQTKTNRGFGLIEFTDKYEAKCTLQKSSLATEDAIWLGVDDANPKIMASKVMEGGTGWVKYLLHPDVMINTRMHLTQEQVADLIPVLQKFVDTGEIT